MTRDDLIKAAICSKLTTTWHWFSYHFNFYVRGETEPFVESLLDALGDLEAAMPGYGKSTIERLAASSGREKNLHDYWQLISQLAEILVLTQVVRADWNQPGVSFLREPGSTRGLQNPEIAIECPEWCVSVEVKTPNGGALRNARSAGHTQLLTRLETKPTGKVVLPRDNTIKDFLMSAQSKFETMSKSYPRHYGLLFIVWDDQTQEPLSALLGPSSGLFTENSFCKDDTGHPAAFPDVDGVILIRHLHHLVDAAAQRELFDDVRHALDYGSSTSFPPKVLIENPWSPREVPAFVLRAFQAQHWYSIPSAETRPIDQIWW